MATTRFLKEMIAFLKIYCAQTIELYVNWTRFLNIAKSYGTEYSRSPRLRTTLSPLACSFKAIALMAMRYRGVAMRPNISTR